MKENNKFLADFLGLETTEFHENLYLFTEETFDLEYSKIWNPRLDWNQLMQVIKKILIVCSELDDMEKFFLIKDEIPNMYNTYEECLKFIKLYGKNFN
jgi:hypothetical protein